MGFESMRILTLDAGQVAASLPMRECVEEMSRAFAMEAEKRFQSPARTRLAAPAGDILVMPALAERKSTEGSVKVVSIFPNNKGGTPPITSIVILLDGETGEPRALMDGRRLTAIRTGAVSGLSCRYLARRDSVSLGIIGAGAQSFEQVNGVASELRRIERVKIYSRELARSKALARQCKRALGLDSVAVDDPRDCVRGSDVVVTATTSKTPVFDGRTAGQGVHVIAIGSYRPDARELDSSLVCRASIFVDSREAALAEAGDLLIPISEGKLSRDSVKGDLSELVTGKAKGRGSSTEVTLFKSVGLALEDNAAGWLAYRRAIRKRVGKWKDL